MMPTLEEIEKINEKMGENPDMPLGQAEQFLLNLSEIDCLLERLRLWLFMLDYQNIEKVGKERAGGPISTICRTWPSP